MHHTQMQESLLMVFCKYPQPGKVKTRLAQMIGDIEAAAICKAMLLDLLEIHQDQPYDLILETNQGELSKFLRDTCWVSNIREATGDDLRGPNSILWNAFRHHCKSYRKVLSIYADVPFLDPGLVMEGFSSLDKKDVVVGPCMDSGYYLIGMSKPIDLFTPHRRGRHAYYRKTMEIIEQRGLSYHLLAPRCDIDTVNDIRVINWNSNSTVWLRTQSVLQRLKLLTSENTSIDQ